MFGLDDNGADICANCKHRRDKHSSYWDNAMPDYCTFCYALGEYCGCETFVAS